MFYCDRINIGKGIDLAKSNSNKEGIISPYWFFNHSFNHSRYVCNRCYDLAMLSVNISDIAIIHS